MTIAVTGGNGEFGRAVLDALGGGFDGREREVKAAVRSLTKKLVRDRIAADYIPRPAVRLVQSMIGRLAGGVLANSEATLATLAAARDGQPRYVIPDSVELSPYAPAPGTRDMVFGILGRIAPWKGQDLFLRAFAAAFAGGPERAVIVGTPMFGEQDYELELHELVASLGLEGRVEFRGFREDIWRELASFDALVHASLIPEPFGMVVLEGMAAGLAVIPPRCARCATTRPSASAWEPPLAAPSRTTGPRRSPPGSRTPMSACSASSRTALNGASTQESASDCRCTREPVASNRTRSTCQPSSSQHVAAPSVRSPG